MLFKRALSAVARAVTGTRWNGLVFFGLAKRGKNARAARKGPNAVQRTKSAFEKDRHTTSRRTMSRIIAM